MVRTLFYGDVEVPVVAVKEGSYRVGVLEIKFKPGVKTEVPYRVLGELLKEGAVRIDEDSLIGLQDLGKVMWMESKTQDLTKLEEGFYLKAMLYFKGLRRRVLEGDEEAERKYRKAKIVFEDIVRLRLTKISQLAVANPVPSRDLMSRMTREEKVFYARLCSLVGTWERGLKDFVEVGEE